VPYLDGFPNSKTANAPSADIRCNGLLSEASEPKAGSRPFAGRCGALTIFTQVDTASVGLPRQVLADSCEEEESSGNASGRTSTHPGGACAHPLRIGMKVLQRLPTTYLF
jgi:hypothetical protein